MKKIILALFLGGVLGASEMVVSVDGAKFEGELFENESANAFGDRFPLYARMQPVSKDGKYFYSPEFIPGKSEKISQIHEGDVVLYDNRYVMIFTSDFAPSHAYARIGRIKNPANLRQLFEKNKVSIKFERK